MCSIVRTDALAKVIPPVPLHTIVLCWFLSLLVLLPLKERFDTFVPCMLDVLPSSISQEDQFCVGSKVPVCIAHIECQCVAVGGGTLHICWVVSGPHIVHIDLGIGLLSICGTENIAHQ